MKGSNVQICASLEWIKEVHTACFINGLDIFLWDNLSAFAVHSASFVCFCSPLQI